MWFEDCYNDNEKRLYRVLKTLYRKESEYQNIELFKLANQGITLVLDGHARVFEIDEFIYHEGITYPALCRHHSPRSILVVGDGDGGIIRELLKYPYPLRIDWVEIDKEVISACASHLPSFPHNSLSDEKVNLLILDGNKHISNCNNQYDLIYISVTAQGDCHYSEPFYQELFFKKIKRILSPQGIVTFSVAEFSPISARSYFSQVATIKKYFDNVFPFFVGLPSFGSNWGFALCSDHPVEFYNISYLPFLKFYCKDEDKFMFHLPSYFK